MRRLVGLGYLDRIRSLVGFDIRGLDVLDVGCGSGFYGPLYLMLGARSYTGCDYKLSLDSSAAKDFRAGGVADMGVKAGALPELFRGRIALIEGGWDGLPADRLYDLVTMYLVTEHIMDPAGAFERIAELLRPGGRMVFLHHNYSSWNGHHQKPATVDEIDAGDPAQSEYVDWGHLRRRVSPEDYVARKLNRLRLDELRELVGRRFEIASWSEGQAGPKQGAGRLTPEIRAALPGYTERELTTQNVRCIARKRTEYISRGGAVIAERGKRAD